MLFIEHLEISIQIIPWRFCILRFAYVSTCHCVWISYSRAPPRDLHMCEYIQKKKDSFVNILTRAYYSYVPFLISSHVSFPRVFEFWVCVQLAICMWELSVLFSLRAHDRKGELEKGMSFFFRGSGLWYIYRGGDCCVVLGVQVCELNILDE